MLEDLPRSKFQIRIVIFRIDKLPVRFSVSYDYELRIDTLSLVSILLVCIYFFGLFYYFPFPLLSLNYVYGGYVVTLKIESIPSCLTSA